MPRSAPPTLEDGRLDELAARHRMRIAEVRRMMGPQQIQRQRAGVVAEIDEVAGPSQAGEPPATVGEEPATLDDGRLEELAASLGVTVGDVRRMVELAPRRTYRGRLDVEEVRRRYEAGESLAEMGAAMGASDTTVRHAMVRAGIPTRPGPRQAGERRGPLHRLDLEEIRRRREAGEKIVGIAGPSARARAGSGGRSSGRGSSGGYATPAPTAGGSQWGPVPPRLRRGEAGGRPSRRSGATLTTLTAVSNGATGSELPLL